MLGIEKQYDPILLEKDTRGPLIRQPEEHIVLDQPILPQLICFYVHIDILNNVLNPGAILDDDLLYQNYMRIY